MRTGWVASPLLISIVLLSACGSGGANPSAGRTSGARDIASPTASAGQRTLIVLTTTDATAAITLRLVDTSGHVVAATRFVPPPRPAYSNCAPILQSPVVVAAGAVYFADRTGLVRKLGVDGSLSTVATFRLANAQQALSYAVSPDGRQLIAIVLSTPPLHNPPPRQLGDPFFAAGYWTLDLETAVAGGATTLRLHKNIGTSLPSPTVITGWDAFGPTATLGSWICTQNVIPSLHYTSGTLIHLGLDGTHLDRIGGADCSAWDELNDGTVVCGGHLWDSFSVRRRNGDVVWSGGGGELFFVRLSPDGNAVASLDGTVYLRYPVAPASFARHAEPQTTILGWADSATVVVLRADGRIGTAPESDPTMFHDLGLAVDRTCATCGLYEVTSPGSLSVA